MKAISLTQPWATLVAIGAKRYETRSWRTDYRGPLAIHATKSFPRWAIELALTEPFRSTLGNAGYRTLGDLPHGAVLCIVDLTGCFPTPPAGWPRAPHGGYGDGIPASPKELAFGDYGPNRYAWRLENLWVLPEPVPATGAQGLWNVELPEPLAAGGGKDGG